MFKKLLNIAIKLSNLGVDENTYHEEKRKINLLNMTGFLLFFIGLLMAILNYSIHNYYYTLIMAMFCFLIFLSLFTLYKFKSSKQSSIIMCLTLLLLSFFLIYSGGVENNGHMWVLVMPPIFILVFGLRLGLYSLLFLLFSFGIMFIVPGNLLIGTIYSSDFKLRFVFAFFGTSLFSIFSEYARVRLVNKINEKNLHLNKIIKEVKELSGLIPICANCKKIRDDKGYWNEVEVYIKDHSKADFSHGICPTCVKKLYPQLNMNK